MKDFDLKIMLQAAMEAQKDGTVQQAVTLLNDQ